MISLFGVVVINETKQMTIFFEKMAAFEKFCEYESETREKWPEKVSLENVKTLAGYFAYF